LCKRAKEQIALAACSVVSYDLGFKKVVGKKSLEKWLQQIDNAVRHGNVRSAIRIKHKGRTGTGYTDRITQAHPTYLHEMFRQATRLLGDDATYEEIATTMNLQSAGLQDLPTLTLDKFKLL
jgi:hypothetical protein